MVLKLYGNVLTICTQRVLVVAKQLEVPVELVPVDFLAGAHKAPEYLEKHPLGQVPYLDDDGFILFESRAISKYLSAAYGNGKLVPKGAKEIAIFEQGVSIEQADFDPYAAKIVIERLFKTYRGLKTDETLASAQQAELEKKLDAYEVILSKQKYIGGNELTLADLFHLPFGSKAAVPTKPGAPFVNFEDPKRPHFAKWWKEISTLPAWKAVEVEEQAAIAAVMAKA